MSKEITIILTCGGGNHIPNIINHLKNIDGIKVTVVTTDMNTDAVGKYFADYFYTTPNGASVDYAEKLLDICQKYSANIIIPFSDEEALTLAKYRDSFKQMGCTILGSDFETTKIAANKFTMLQTLKKQGVPTPKFFAPKNIKDVHSALTELGYPEKLIVFKPFTERGSRGFRLIDANFDELDHILSSKKELFLSLDRLINLLKSKEFFPEFLLMEYLEGEDFNIDVLVENGECKYIVPQQRLVPDYGPVEVGYVKFQDEIDKIIKQIVSVFNFEFLVNIEVAYQKFSVEGQLLPYEINVRPSAPIIATMAAGCSLLEEAIFQALSIDRPVKSLSEVKMIRYWGELFVK